ncbi:hypothetical protein HJFPF1_06942 [Paramyrothecium foliicola]|nr:hypothetical protein HJFPF1_06942 [Paramyrothecium foliicola]
MPQNRASTTEWISYFPSSKDSQAVRKGALEVHAVGITNSAALPATDATSLSVKNRHQPYNPFVRLYVFGFRARWAAFTSLPLVFVGSSV